jgi:hypothetical protein
MSNPNGEKDCIGKNCMIYDRAQDDPKTPAHDTDNKCLINTLSFDLKKLRERVYLL